MLLRGLGNAVQEWHLLAACHNLRKLHGHLGVAGLDKAPTGHLRPLGQGSRIIRRPTPWHIKASGRPSGTFPSH